MPRSFDAILDVSGPSSMSRIINPFTYAAPVGGDADLSDFVARVLANGGTISAGTQTAAGNFITAAKANGYWTKLNRINLFCGDQLAAALVPLKVGGGNATDTNISFVSGDYTEATGLTSLVAGKYLNSGLVANTLTANNTHLAVYNRTTSAAGGNITMGAGGVFDLYAPYADGVFYSDQYNSAGGRVSAAVAAPYGLLVASRTGAGSHVLYKNGSSIASSASSGGALTGDSIYIFADNTGGSPGLIGTYTLAAYSIGDGLTGGEVASYNTDMEAFQDALSRGVM